MRGLLNIAKYLSAIGVIATAALWLDARFDNQVDSNEAMIDSLEVVKQDIFYNSVHLSQMDADIQGIQDTLVRQANKINTIAWGLKNQNRFTPEDRDLFESIIDEMLKKNNMWTPYVYE